MKNTRKIVTVLTAAALTVFMAGCDLLGVTPDITEYVETAQESASDNEELKAYMEELRPVLDAFYDEGRTLKEAAVRGNEINLEIDLGESSTPYKNFEELMVYETTRVTHSILNYRDYEVVNSIYRINLNFTGRKTVTLYWKQAAEKEGVLDFDARTILDAVKRP